MAIPVVAKNLPYFVSTPWKLHNRYCHTVYKTGIAIWGKLNINAKWLLLGLTLRGYLCWIDHSRLWINATIMEFQDISYEKLSLLMKNHLQKEHTFRLIEKKIPCWPNCPSSLLWLIVLTKPFPILQNSLWKRE